MAKHDKNTATVTDGVAIKTIDLTKTFRDFWMRPRVRAVDNVNLEIRRGEVFGLLGPNGSGKSTTIKMLLGLLQPTAGRVVVLGKRADDVANKNHIGYLPEESYLYRFLNAYETLDYYGRLFHQNKAKRHARIEMLLEMVGLTHAARRPVGEYSKGMQRKIGLAQALINDPQLLILDEPTTGMDPIGTSQVKELIRTLAERGKTILLCSHLLADVEDVCDRVAIMFGGKIRAMGTCEELLVKQTATSFTLPAMDEQTKVQLVELLESRGLHVDRVEQPRQRLEDLFLDIVHAAQNEGMVTSGSRGGGRLADFLTDDEAHASPGHMPEDIQAAAIIDQLMADEQAKMSAPPSSRPQPQQPQVDEDLLKDLSAPQPVEPRDTPASPRKAEPEEQADQSVIDSLINDSKK